MGAGQYIRHALLYFLKLMVLLVLIYALLFVTGFSRVSADHFVAELFNSYRGLMLFGAMLLLAAFYPMFGFVKRTVGADINGDREEIINAFHTGGYTMIREEEGRCMTFRASSGFRKLWMAFDDKITVTGRDGNITIEGIRKETVQAEFRIETFIRNR